MFISNFETLALPIFTKSSTTLIIDEIGKMELLSNNFESAIKDFIKKQEDKNNESYLVATIPSRGQFPVVEKLKSIKGTKTFIVTKQNRTNIYDTILRAVKNMVSPKSNNKK